MKTRFSTLDLFAITKDLRRKLKGLRVNQVYDIDNRTYLIRLHEKDTNFVLLLESGIRVHTTSYEWPKQPAPSTFTMKLRKHIGNKRLENIEQLGVDRVLDLTFGSGEAAYHLIVELYDRGNILLTDSTYMIINVLRPRTVGEEVKFAVREVYQKDRARQYSPLISESRLKEILHEAKPNAQIKKLLVPHVEFGGALLEHCLVEAGFPGNVSIGKGLDIQNDAQIAQLYLGLVRGEEVYQAMLKSDETVGFIIQKEEKRPKNSITSRSLLSSASVPVDQEMESVLTYAEFQPHLFSQLREKPFARFDNFDAAVDEFFSKIESQRLDQKAFQQQKEAVKKLTNVKEDQERRILQLKDAQELDFKRGRLVEANTELVEKALTVLRSAVGAQMSWDAIEATVKEAQAAGDPVAMTIKSLNLPKNMFTMELEDPYDDETEKMAAEIRLDLSAHANAREYFHQRRYAAQKQQKTVESTSKALKSAEKRTKQTLKEAAAVATINKARKIFWFEKFFWFISSENYLVIAGRDQQQNELIVKRFMKPPDVYVHADLHGASSVIVKNKLPSTTDPSVRETGDYPAIPVKTLNEAGVFAVCHSSTWDAKVVTSAWWVNAPQVSKTAPTGEYLSTGSFMVRGKKNYLPPCHLIVGFGFVFRVDDDSIERHQGERRVKDFTDAQESVTSETQEVEEEIALEDDGDDEIADTAGAVTEENPLEPIQEVDDKPEFPDTTVNVEYTQDEEYVLRTESVTLAPQQEMSELTLEGTGRKKPPRAAVATGKRMEQAIASRGVPTQPEEKDRNEGSGKRRKAKVKKMKEKYKDQDDEERALRMAILGSAGEAKEKKKKGGALEQQISKKKKAAMAAAQARKNAEVVRNDEEIAEEEEDWFGEALKRIDQEEQMLTSLTGLPTSEDEILFAVPVVAPYNAMSNYKFRVKMTPGTGKRGKAAKTALNLFLSDRGTTAREKDLLKSVKDQDLARNIPGKVKLSAPHMQRGKKK